jgi:hypothetical protein
MLGWLGSRRGMNLRQSGMVGDEPGGVGDGADSN